MALNVLLADDSATMREIVAKTIKMSGVPVNQFFHAADGREGLEVLDREWIDVILLDINMPVMDGMQMIKEMRARPELAKTPIIVVSTESSQTRIEEIRANGAEFIHKPFTPEQVREVLNRVLGATEDAGN